MHATWKYISWTGVAAQRCTKIFPRFFVAKCKMQRPNLTNFRNKDLSACFSTGSISQPSTLLRAAHWSQLPCYEKQMVLQPFHEINADWSLSSMTESSTLLAPRQRADSYTDAVWRKRYKRMFWCIYMYRYACVCVCANKWIINKQINKSINK